MKQLYKIFPILSVIAALAIQIFLPNSKLHPQSKHYFTYVLIGFLVIYLILYLISQKNRAFDFALSYRGIFIGGVLLFLNILNILTAKTAVLPVLYFPSLDRIFGVIVEQTGLLTKCVLYSTRLLTLGIFFGALTGFVTGILLGFSKTFAYWINPLIRIFGPIPSTAWIPLVLIVFPTAVSASTFLVALAVWFPTTVMTSSGISNIQNTYFETAATLGAKHRYQIFKVGIPAAMPNMFLGLFNGICSSFITLVTAEMIGAKYGIGWYINWQKEMLSYSNVYAGLIIVAVYFSLLILLLFRVRDKFLVWQKGVIKW